MRLRRVLKAVVIVVAWLWAYFLIVGLARCASAPSLQPATTLRVCTFAIMQRNGELVVLYERAQIVGEVAGKDEWWLLFLDRASVLDREGHARAINFPKERVLRIGEVRIVGMSRCRCPESFR